MIARRDTALLSAGQTLYFAGVSIDLTLTGLVGIRLAPSPALATLPLAMITAVGAVGAVLAGLLAPVLGYRAVIATSAGFAVLGGLVSAGALVRHSFVLFCCGTGLVGLYRAGGGYLRYLAVEGVPAPDRKRVLSVLLAGGLVASFIGPFLAVRSSSWFSVRYLGSFGCVAMLALITIPLVLAVRTAPRPAVDDGPKPAPLRIRDVPDTVNFVTGLLMLVISGGVMTMIMAIGPIGSAAAGHGLDMGAAIIQWHLVAMFAPSVVSGRLLERLGVHRTGALGALSLCAGAVAGVLGSADSNFMTALVLNGLGWNLLYLAGSSLIVDCYPSGRGGRVQAVAEGIAAAAAVLSSVSASGVFHAIGWQGANYLPLGLSAALLFWLVGAGGSAEPDASAGQPEFAAANGASR